MWPKTIDMRTCGTCRARSPTTRSFNPRILAHPPTFEIRYAGSAAEMLRLVRTAVASVDPGLTMFQVTTLEARTRDSLARERLLAMLSTYVGGFALLLACIGLYGLMAYSVVQRTPELGLRLALGSRPSAIRRLVLKDSVMTVVAGAIVGSRGRLAARPVRAQPALCARADRSARVRRRHAPAVVDRGRGGVSPGLESVAHQSGHCPAAGVKARCA